MYESRRFPVYLLDRFLALLLPVGCLSCSRLLEPGHHPLLLCRICRGRVHRPLRGRCPRCLRSSAGVHYCSERKGTIDSVVAPWPYSPPLDAVLQGLKFRKLDFLGEALAGLLRDELASLLTGDEVVTAIPLHGWRRLQRGFDQAECIARPLAERLGLPYRKLLRRRRWTRPQTRLGRARRRVNMEGAFIAPARIERSVLLVDDVLTTGATMEAAAIALRLAGATRIIVAAVAATPSQRGSST